MNARLFMRTILRLAMADEALGQVGYFQRCAYVKLIREMLKNAIGALWNRESRALMSDFAEAIQMARWNTAEGRSTTCTN